MDDQDFEDAIARALHGEVMTDLRPPPELLDALLAIAAARTPADRRTAVRAARALQEREEAPDVDEVDIDEADIDENEELLDDDGFRID